MGVLGKQHGVECFQHAKEKQKNECFQHAKEKQKNVFSTRKKNKRKCFQHAKQKQKNSFCLMLHTPASPNVLGMEGMYATGGPPF